MIAAVSLVMSEPVETNLSSGYVIGALIALFILAYLLYSLARPGKF